MRKASGQSSILDYLIAAASAVTAVGAILAVEEPLGAPPFTLLVAGVMFAAWWGGLGPGLLATVIGGLAISYFFEEPRYSFSVASPITLVRILVFVGIAFFVSWLNARRHAAIGEARAARDAAALLASIVDTSDDAIVGVDSRGTVVTWNPGAERLYGYRADEIVGQPVTRLVRSDQPSELPNLLERLRQGDRFGHFETQRIARDGRRLDVSVTASPLLEGDELVGASLIERDITWRRAAADAAERLAAIVAASDDAIVGQTLEGIVTSWNPAAERLHGFTAGEMIGRSIATVVPPERADELKWMLASVSGGESFRRLRTIRLRKDGRRVAVALTLSPVRDATERIIGAAAVARELEEESAVGPRPALQRLHHCLAASGDPSACLPELLEAARTSAGSDSATLYRWDASRSGLVPIAAVPSAVRPDGFVRAGEGAAGQAAARRERFVLNDYPRSEHAVAAAVAAGVQAAMAVPVLLHGELLGALSVASRESGKVFGDEAVAALETVSFAAAVILNQGSGAGSKVA